MFYEAKVQVSIESEGGKPKKSIENYLVEAVSVTDAEVKVTKDFEGQPIDWTLKGVQESKIIKIIN